MGVKTILQTPLKRSILVIERAFCFPIIDQNQVAHTENELKDYQHTG